MFTISTIPACPNNRKGLFHVHVKVQGLSQQMFSKTHFKYVISYISNKMIKNKICSHSQNILGLLFRGYSICDVRIWKKAAANGNDISSSGVNRVRTLCHCLNINQHVFVRGSCPPVNADIGACMYQETWQLRDLKRVVESVSHKTHEGSREWA